MDFLLHWSVGFILGTLIVIPFIFGRWIYDYNTHTWVRVRWGPVSGKGTTQHLTKLQTESATKELYPLTSSRFILYHLIVANVCGFLSLAPDLEQIWGANGGDHALWANFFFFHASIDKLDASTVDVMTGYAFITAILVWMMVIGIATNAQIDRDGRENIFNV